MLRRSVAVRRNLLPSACLAVVLLAMVMAVSAADIIGNLAAGWPGRWVYLWADVVAVAGVFFMRWLTRARANAETYPVPGAEQVRDDRLWEVGGW